MAVIRETGLFTRVTAWVALAIEVVNFVAKPLKLAALEKMHDGLEGAGIVLFLISLVSWLEASNKGLAKLDEMDAKLQVLAKQAESLDMVGRYGMAAGTLAHLLNPQGTDRNRFQHCRAGGATLSHLLLNTYGQAVDDFHRSRTGHVNEVKLTEASIINLFLKDLVESLPVGSVWLGTSRLQDSGAWEKDTAEPAYYEFERAVEKGVGNKTLTCLRVHCFENGERHQQMTHIGEKQSQVGLQVRTLLRQDLPPGMRDLPDDMSLIWVPTSSAGPKVDLNDPVASLERGMGIEPLCGIKFGIRADREVYTMALVDPGNQEFSTLKATFRNSWRAAA